jgi:NADH-quinone oxidoreductase subunit M
MVSHGFSSSALFVLANLCYEKMGSRRLLLIGGLFSFCPSICLFLFLFIIINSGTPPFVNFYNEIFLIKRVSYMWPLIGFPLVFSLFFSFLYNVYLYVSVAHGKQPAAKRLCNDFITLIVLFIHAFPLLIFVWVPSIFFDAIL